MKCKQCGAEWNLPENSSMKISKCPFCGADMLNVEDARNITNFGEFMAFIVSIYGKEIFVLLIMVLHMLMKLGINTLG